jgi:glycosyltransferase involved in cell wall biosynthesis
MSRIVIDARELRTSSGRYVERLLHYLQRIDEQNEYVILLKPVDASGWQPSGRNFRIEATNYKEFTFGEQLGFKKQIERLKPDLVHFTFPQQPVLYRGKTVTTIHDLTTLRFDNPAKNMLVFKFKQLVYGQVIKRAVRKAAEIIAISEFTKNDVLNYAGVRSEKVTVTHESADPITDNPSPLPDLQNTQFIMYVGRPTPHKNLERLIEAHQKLRERFPGLRLVLTGKKDVNYQRIEAMVAGRELPDVVFTGFVSEGQLRWLYENCAAYVFPSLSEGFGLPGLEAMAHGAPVVSSNATCLPEIYGDAAQYFDPKDTAAMAAAIGTVLSDIDLRNSLIAAGKNQVVKYSWQRMAEQTLSIYKEALRK